MVKLYGIPNCDTVKKARTWLESNGIDYEFIDFRKTPLNAAQLKSWADAIDWQNLLNKRSRTWKDIPDSKKEPLDKNNALALMLENATLIKRPVLDNSGDIHVGFKDTEYRLIFA